MATRSHWQIENSLHWVLDTAFREDEIRVPKDHGAIADNPRAGKEVEAPSVPWGLAKGTG
jgi:hypothetical protein